MSRTYLFTLTVAPRPPPHVESTRKRPLTSDFKVDTIANGSRSDLPDIVGSDC
jgi:hypothetical protein